MLNLTSIMLNTEDFDRLLEFYTQLFDKKPDWQDGHYAGFDSKGIHLMLGFHDKVKGKNPAPERLLINFTTTDVDTEFDRLVKLGAKVVAKPYYMEENSKDKIATLSDPDGNFIQLMTPMS